MKKYIVILCLCNINLLFAKIHPSNTHFTSPVKYNVRLAGSFGEIRSKHFHAGIDIRSNKGGGGDSIFSAEDGYISRIKIDRSGYGKSLYITHQNGYTTVYAHLNSFSKEVDEYVLNMQYQMMSYEIDIMPESDRFTIYRGKHIGYLGNTGYSFGPHLHFEIRETHTNKVMNPLLFGIKPIDNVTPEITQVRISGLTSEFEKIFDQKIAIKKDKKGNVHPIEMLVPAWRTGIAIRAYDKCTGCVNKNGIYRLEMYVDDTLTYSFEMKSFDFDENKLLEAHTDYEAKQNENTNEILCYKLPGNKLSFIENGINDGLINLYESKYRKIVIKVSDYAGNITAQEIRLKRSEVSPYKENTLSNGQHVEHYLPHVLVCDGASLTFRENSFAKKDIIQFSKVVNEKSTYQIKNNSSPILNKFRLAIKMQDSFLLESNKLVLVKTSSKGGNISYGSEISEDSIITFSEDMGIYKIIIDKIPPTIKPINFTPKPKTQTFRFKISDNIECSYKAKDFSYNVWMDDIWIPCEFKELSKTLSVPIGSLNAGDHYLKIQAEDQKGNIGYWEGMFQTK